MDKYLIKAREIIEKALSKEGIEYKLEKVELDPKKFDSELTDISKIYEIAHVNNSLLEVREQIERIKDERRKNPHFNCKKAYRKTVKHYNSIIDLRNKMINMMDK